MARLIVRQFKRQRITPTVGVPDGDGIVLIASNWGQKTDPAWSANLCKNPEVILEFDGRAGPYTAHEVTEPAERQSGRSVGRELAWSGPGHWQQPHRDGRWCAPVMLARDWTILSTGGGTGPNRLAVTAP